MNNTFIEKYIKSVKDAILPLRKDIDEKELEKFIYDKYIKSNELLKNKKAKLVNNYTNVTNTYNLVKLINFFYNKKPILTAFGTFYYTHKDRRNLNADFINFLMATRKYHKNLQFEGQNEHDKQKESFHKKHQTTWKLLNNSFYGVLGQSSSQFFNIFISQSITYMGYAIITTSIIAFERFLSNNYKYENFNDLLIFLTDTIKDSKGLLKYLDKDKIKSKEFIKKYVSENLINFELTEKQKNTIDEFIDKCNRDEYNSLYYRNNLYKFLENSYFIKLLEPIFSKDIINPNKDIIDEDKETIKHIWDILKQYVYTKRQLFEREEYVPNMTRKTILGCDTDSNFVSIDKWHNWVEEHFNFERNKFSKFTISNILISILSYFIQDALDVLTSNCNVPIDKQKLINMKSEILFDLIIFTRNKKNYISKISLKEGNLVDPPETDIKGLSIRKSTVPNKTRKFFMNLVKNEFLIDDINIPRILKLMNKFEDYIKNSLKKGNVEFLKPAKLNDVNSYKEPYSQQVVRGAIAWNTLFPDNTIEPPEKVNILKLNGKNIEDLQPIYEDEHFSTIKDLAFNPDKNPEMSNFGFDVICVPKNLNKIPEWIIPLIDIDSVIDDNVRNVNILLNSLGLELMEYKNKEYYSNFISF